MNYAMGTTDLGVSDVTLVRATPADAPALAVLNLRLIQDEGHPNSMTVPQLQERMAVWLTGTCVAWMAVQTSATIGYCLARDDGDAVYIRQLCSAPSSRRRGIGKALVNGLSATAWSGRTCGSNAWSGMGQAFPSGGSSDSPITA
jgi:hypothetical protein